MHDKIERIQQMINDVFEKSTSSMKKLTKKSNMRCSAESHAIKTNVKYIFREKKNRTDIQKDHDNKKNLYSVITNILLKYNLTTHKTILVSYARSFKNMF